MVRTFTAALFLAVAALPALADEAENPDIEAVIGDQIAALRADDFATAFTYASPMIQGMFGTPETFGEMVKQGYPMVWHPAGVTYLQLREVAGGLWQRIMVTDASGRVWMLDYRMVQVDGAWRIDGVQILPAQGVGA